MTQYAEDLDAAAALLDQAGWTDIRGGIRHNAKGQPLSIELMTTAGNRSRELVEQVLQSQWRRLGIDVRIQNEPARVFFGETVDKRKFSGMAMFAWISAPENVPRTTLYSEEIPTAANGWAGQNDAGLSNPEVDKLIDDIESELDRDKREAMWHRLQQIYAEELPALPLYFRADAAHLADVAGRRGADRPPWSLARSGSSSGGPGPAERGRAGAGGPVMRYLIHRLLEAALVLLLMSFVIYGLIGLMPGDPIDLMASGNPNITTPTSPG